MTFSVIFKNTEKINVMWKGSFFTIIYKNKEKIKKEYMLLDGFVEISFLIK